MAGNIVLKADIEVIDMCLDGVRFLITKRLNTNSRCLVSLNVDKTRVSLEGIVVRSSLKEGRQLDRDFQPVYEVAVRFNPLSEKRKTSLQKIIDHLRECKGSAGS